MLKSASGAPGVGAGSMDPDLLCSQAGRSPQSAVRCVRGTGTVICLLGHWSADLLKNENLFKKIDLGEIPGPERNEVGIE